MIAAGLTLLARPALCSDGLTDSPVEQAETSRRFTWICDFGCDNSRAAQFSGGPLPLFGGAGGGVGKTWPRRQTVEAMPRFRWNNGSALATTRVEP